MGCEWITNPTDPRVREALTRKCHLCRRPPGEPCRHPFETREPLGRVVHFERLNPEALVA